jgi:hypothetical protein
MEKPRVTFGRTRNTATPVRLDGVEVGSIEQHWSRLDGTHYHIHDASGRVLTSGRTISSLARARELAVRNWTGEERKHG